MTDQNTQVVTPPAAAPPPATPPAAGAENVQNPEAQAASREAANYRTKLREAEARLTTLQEENDRLKEPATATGGTKGEIAKLNRDVSELRSKTEAAEKTAREEREKRIEKQIDADLARGASGVLDEQRQYATRLLKTYVSVDDDGVTVFEVQNEKGEKVKVPATEEAARKLLPASFYPAKGVGGSGSGGPREAASSGIDWNRVKTDQAYFEANYDRIKAARKAGEGR